MDTALLVAAIALVLAAAALAVARARWQLRAGVWRSRRRLRDEVLLAGGGLAFVAASALTGAELASSLAVAAMPLYFLLSVALEFLRRRRLQSSRTP